MPQPWKPRVLRQYAFIADGERGALIDPDGAIGWLCIPEWDSPAMFAAILGGRGGYAVTPTDSRHVWGGHYGPAAPRARRRPPAAVSREPGG
jgi:alpha,alpha-trehalase